MDPGDKSIKGQLSRRSQKGAVTRAQRQLQAAQQGGRVRLSGRAGVIRPGARKAAPAAVKRTMAPRTREAQVIRALTRINDRARAVNGSAFSKRRQNSDVTISRARMLLTEQLFGDKVKRASANYHRNVQASRDRNNPKARRAVEVALAAKDIYKYAYTDGQARGRREVTVRGLTLRPRRRR